jgi:hypothetical protein
LCELGVIKHVCHLLASFNVPKAGVGGGYIDPGSHAPIPVGPKA